MEGKGACAARGSKLAYGTGGVPLAWACVDMTGGGIATYSRVGSLGV